MEERAGGDRGLQPTTGAHPQPCARAPAVTAAAVWTREPVRPAQFGQILPTGPLVGEPRPKLLVSPRIVTPTDRSQIASHDRPPYCTQADMQDIRSWSRSGIWPIPERSTTTPALTTTPTATPNAHAATPSPNSSGSATRSHSPQPPPPHKGLPRGESSRQSHIVSSNPRAAHFQASPGPARSLSGQRSGGCIPRRQDD